LAMLTAIRRASSRVIRCAAGSPVKPAVFHFLGQPRGTEV
jgi:hypothetical protein